MLGFWRQLSKGQRRNNTRIYSLENFVATAENKGPKEKIYKVFILKPSQICEATV
jgi:hypothetical protein